VARDASRLLAAGEPGGRPSARGPARPAVRKPHPTLPPGNRPRLFRAPRVAPQAAHGGGVGQGSAERSTPGCGIRRCSFCRPFPHAHSRGICLRLPGGPNRSSFFKGRGQRDSGEDGVVVREVFLVSGELELPYGTGPSATCACLRRAARGSPRPGAAYGRGSGSATLGRPARWSGGPDRGSAPRTPACKPYFGHGLPATPAAGLAPDAPLGRPRAVHPT